MGDEVHLAIAAVRYETHGRARSGVASVHVADRIRDGAKLRVRLKPNRHFRLPQDPATDIIMVGPGTGVAPFRAFVQERRAVEAPGRSWLFFGDRHFTHDFLYQLEWQDALEDGSLTKIDVAFSPGPAGEGLRAGPGSPSTRRSWSPGWTGARISTSAATRRTWPRTCAPRS